MKYDNYLRLEILTPVHIGSGDTSDPLDYVITSKNGEDYFCRIDLDAWLEDYPDQEALAKVLDGGKLPVIRKFIADNLDADIYARSSSKIISPEIAKKYRQHIANLNSPNQLLIDPTLKNPLTGGLLIPGSSIKGAMRTAVIDFLDLAAPKKLKFGNYNEGIKNLLGDIQNNTFKQLKIGDFELSSECGQLLSAKSKPKNPKNTKKPPHNDCEVCSSKVLSKNGYESFGKIAIGSQSDKNSVSLKSRTGSWNLQQLMKLVSDFYQKRYIEERNKFYHQSHFSQSHDVVQLLDRELLHLEENQMILRVGHYSHIECMTVTHRDPKCKIVKGEKVYGVLRTLADGIYPFGWVKLTLCSQTEYDHYWQQKQQQERELAQDRQQLRQTKIEQRQQQLQQQLEQQRQQQQAEQERLAKEQDERDNPWKKVVRQLDQIKNWGDLKQQILEKEELAAFRQVTEFTQAVYDQVIIVRNFASKWGEDRDELIAQWFEPTAQQWQQQVTVSEKTTQLSKQEQLEIESIIALKDWGVYKADPVELSTLSLVALEELKTKLKQWGCDKKKTKKDKQEIWKKVDQLIIQKTK